MRDLQSLQLQTYRLLDFKAMHFQALTAFLYLATVVKGVKSNYETRKNIINSAF